MKRTVRAIALCSAVLAATATTALAGPPGKWTRITEPNGVNIDEVAVARTADKRLHVVWKARLGVLNDAVKHVAITFGGKVAGPASVVAQGFNTVNDPDIVVLPSGGLQVFFGGLGNADPANGIQSATSDVSGSAWAFLGKVSNSRIINRVGASVRPDGTPVFAWYTTGELLSHLGVNPADPDATYPSGLCCHYDPGLATDEATGQTVMAFFSNVSGGSGTFARTIAPAVGPSVIAPGSVSGGNALQPIERTSIAARQGGRVYVGYCSGYPTCRQARLWRVGAKKALVAGTSRDLEDVAVARGPKGRMWIMWHDEAKNRLYAARTNPAVTRVGARISLKPPPGTRSIWNLTGDGEPGRLDLFAHVTTGGGTASWHTQILPGLTLTASGKKVITFAVRDAGVPVKGAKIKVGGKTLVTNTKGIAKVDLPKGVFTAVATKATHTKATRKVVSL